MWIHLRLSDVELKGIVGLEVDEMRFCVEIILSCRWYVWEPSVIIIATPLLPHLLISLASHKPFFALGGT